MPYPSPLPILLPAILWILLGPVYIRFLKQKMLGQYIREDGPQQHHQKAGTPTMGGLLIVAVVLFSLTLALAFGAIPITAKLLWAALVLVVFGLLGFSDDYLKIAKKKNKGLSGWTKLLIQVLTGGAIGLWTMLAQEASTLDVFGHGVLSLGWFYPLFVILVITGTSNAYNLTDGLDGLAGGTGLVTFIGFAFLLTQQPDLMLLALFLAGGCLGFLCFNRHPAQIFMGDTGSLALGGVMGTLAVLGKVELYLLLLGGVYVLETLSVILQVIYFKLTHGKRLFKMSPLHHHFELCGWREPTVVLTFVLTQALLSVTAVLLYNTA